MSHQNGHHGKLLVGIEQITDYLGIGKPMFHEFRRNKMPVRFIGGRWLASKDNLDEYFRRATLADSSNIEAAEE